MGINTIVCMFLRDGNQAGQIIKTPYLFYSINMIQTQDTKNMTTVLVSLNEHHIYQFI